ncbi:S8 family serine peptidase [Mongoliitalea lutea]|uniref:PKD domain-containing protein n=1 Tax=Mongoliitalea lutea TaxID=849756 RepID=A0A8J3CXD9_9BACT|nr:S8 family serine peptidase [Mongoliitalea lutea]GHB35280.1 hypothetical protein GCM10008106_15860 [Mongoliitalea lutea]
MRGKLSKVVSVLFFFLYSSAFGQNVPESPSILKEVRGNILKNFNQKYAILSPSEDALKRKASELGIPMFMELDNDRIAKLQYFDELDHPVYYTTFNTAAAVTTGANTLQPGGSLGLNLTGKGLVLGIYDQTRPRLAHVEFQGRLSQPDGSTETISNHATHVSGTMIGAGINPAARGMAYEATGLSFNWDNDVNKMASNAYIMGERNNGHIVSNHSYGIIIGWFRNSAGNWVWSGNANISPDEDFRFGFYSSKSQALDDLSFSLPHYTIVWAAGNDRNDVGDGTRPGDGPADTIGPEGVAKNVITVGAVSSVPQYLGPNSIAMSNFSSWGPTDDGRIKPDIVGMGVGVFSAAISNGGESDSYASLSGTSMASPNVAGTLSLLQQLYRERNGGRFMWSSTVKGLMIHTAREAGLSPGPDYIFGWGLLNAEAAAKHILEDDGVSTITREGVLLNNETFTYEFLSDGIEPIRITVAWTDPAGVPSPASLNPRDLKLVNDLDLRVFDDAGNEFFPWSLDPTRGPSGPAVRNQDNFRDNVEQILIDNPQPRKYTLVLSHKGSLVNQAQEYSLLFSASLQEANSETLYWIGSDSDWDNPSNWSFTLGGQSANMVPGEGSRVIFENTGNLEFTGFTSDKKVFSLNTFGNSNVSINLNGQSIHVTNGVRFSATNTLVSNGEIIFENESQNQQFISFTNTEFKDVKTVFSNGNWGMIDYGLLDHVVVNGGTVSFPHGLLNVRSFEGISGSLIGNLSQIKFQENLSISNQTVLNRDLDFTFAGKEVRGEIVILNSTRTFSLTVASGNLDVENVPVLKVLNVGAGGINIKQTILTSDQVRLTSGAIVNFEDSELLIRENWEVNASSDNMVSIIASNSGIVRYLPYSRLCTDFVTIQNVDLLGDAVVNVGLNSIVTNSDNWLTLNCDDVLFANFTSTFLCAGGFSTFSSTSLGTPTDYTWLINGEVQSSEEFFSFTFPSPGAYEVTLIIRSQEQEVSLTSSVDVLPNPLNQPSIVINGDLLTSLQPAESFQWYLNGLPIQGATARSITANESGLYQVAIISGGCNRISEPVVISSIINNEPQLSKFGIFIGPNPTEGRLTITLSNKYYGLVEVHLVDSAGRKINGNTFNKQEDLVNLLLEINQPQGIYLVFIQMGDQMFTKKIIKK